MKILLVNAYNTQQAFAITQNEAEQLLEVRAVDLCLRDSERLEKAASASGWTGSFIALHPTIDGPDVFAQFVETLNEYRTLFNADGTPKGAPAVKDVNPFTGRVMQIVAPPKDGVELN